LPAGSLLGIYSQLIQTERGAEAMLFVNKNPAKFDTKIQRMAKENATGRPIGAKRITSGDQVYEIIKTAGSRARFHITFRKDNVWNAVAVFGLTPVHIRFDDQNAGIMITNCVVPSGRWEHIPRTYTITVTSILGEQELQMIAAAFVGALESIELISSMVERVSGMQDGITDTLLNENPELFYDKSLFYQACDKINHPHAADLWVLAITSPNVTMLEVLKALPLQHRLNFLEAYIQCFNDALALA
jgi:hypothetical protein